MHTSTQTHIQSGFNIYIPDMNMFCFQVWCINGSAKTPVPKEDIGKFYSGDCYAVLYTYHSHDKKEDYYLCCWIGKDSIEVIYVLIN